MDLHQELVNSLLSAFKSEGYTILRAVVGSYDQPYKIGRHEPDIIAKDKYGLLIIGEAKTGDDIYQQTSKEQFLDFSSRIMSEGLLRGTKIPMHIIVPKDKSVSLREVLTSLGLANKIGSRIFIWVE